jgi:DNA mismatch repair protein MutL
VATARERVFQIFGSGVIEELVELGTCERQLFIPAPSVPFSEAIAEFRREPDEASTKIFRLSGFVSRPQVQKGNRNSIFIFVNGRLIRDRLLLHALSSAYHNLMPAACFPFALLFLECGYDEVDVNVHPSKTEVRFRHQSFVHDFVRDTIRERLIESRPAPAFPLSPAPATTGLTPQPGARMPFSEFSQMLENETAVAEGLSHPPLTAIPLELPTDEPGAVDPRAPEFHLQPARAPEPRFDFGGASIALVADPASEVRLRVPETHGAFPAEAIPPTGSLASLADLRPIGQLHESFIIAAGRDGLWIIDQHVAHERILFEKVLKHRAAGDIEVQRLLMPLIVQLTPEQQIEYARIGDELQSMGFETEPFGNRTLAVKAAPAAIGPADLEKVLFEVLEIAESELRSASLDDIRRAIAASIACRAAIKINTRLDQAKMEWLLRALAGTEFPMSCPHGRPIALQYSTREILKAFHRI